MSKITLITTIRTPLINNKNKYAPLCPRWYSKSDDESSKSKSTINQIEPEIKENSKERLTKLNSLLKEMIKDSSKTPRPNNFELAKPIPKWEKVKKMFGDEKPIKRPQNPEKIIESAAKEVAESLGGDAKKTESELLKKLLGTTDEGKTDSVSSLSDIFNGMKIDTSEKPKTRSEQVKQLVNQYSNRQKQSRSTRGTSTDRAQTTLITKFDNINLFGSEPLGIFTNDLKEYNDNVLNKTWNALTERELKLLVTHPPSNYFQQMILWTEQGKLWKFPIDNEQGLEEEKNISFAEHVFLDKHLEPWCPQKGPIRHFMELVCIGLSKNPYLTVTAKKEHIDWYRNYFEDKRTLLKEVGVALNEGTASK